jgi:ubiquitin conjugation factor E4 B
MGILQKYALKSPEQLHDWEQLASRIATAKEQAELEEADLGEIPDDYMDPIMATLMEDPVRLPSSRAIVDRSTIQSHLLSDAHDPFNRAPLKIDDVVPQDSLREEIQKWKQEKLAQKLAERQRGDAGEPMDTSS